MLIYTQDQINKPLPATVSSTANSTPLIVSTSPASGLSGIVDSVTGAISSAFNSATSALTVLTDVSLPMPNVLSNYATYNYILGIGVLTDNEINFPDKTYIAGAPIALICKSANSDPNNRINTVYGKYDYFIENLSFQTVITADSIATFEFQIVEPYSMGMFVLAVQQAAYEAGHKNWQDATFLLTIEFRGNTQAGVLTSIPDTARYFPFHFNSFDTHVSEKGTRYDIKAVTANAKSKTEKNSNLKNDVSIKGKTVQEVLQTGEKSLQAVINSRLQQFKTDGLVSVPDQVLILFPSSIDSASSAANSNNNSDTKSTATTATQTSSTTADIAKQLGVSQSNINATLVQPVGQCNSIGNADMGFNLERAADIVIAKDNIAYDPKTGTYVRANLPANATEGNFKFAQDSSIQNAISQIVINSTFCTTALGNSNIDKNGMRDWFRIDSSVYYISSDENLDKTGVKPKLYVYRVIIFKGHSSKVSAPNTKPIGIDQIKQEIVKQYDYIYTGKNTEVLKFNIEFRAGFTQVMASDNFTKAQDVLDAASTGAQTAPSSNGAPQDTSISGLLSGLKTQISSLNLSSLASLNLPSLSLSSFNPFSQVKALLGNMPSSAPGVTPTQVSYTATKSQSDKQGGGGSETPGIRAARLFHDGLNVTNEMVSLELEIVGDPYWMAHSGQGNYTAKPTQYKDLNADGSVSYQSSEVDVLVNFRTPIDINQATGLYDFGGTSNVAPVIQWTGLYQVVTVDNSFVNGMFKQTIHGNRRPQQENPNPANPEQVFGI